MKRMVNLSRRARNDFISSVYDAEMLSFTTPVIKTSFKNTGMYPFSPNKIIGLARKHSGKVDPCFENDIQYAVTVIKDTIETNLEAIAPPRRGVKRKRVEVEMDKLYGYGEAEPKILNDSGSVVDIRLSEEERKKRKCIIDDCNHHHYNGKNWFTCEICKGKICPKHKKWVRKHTSCNKDNHTNKE